MESNRPANWNLLWDKVMKKVRIKKTVIVIAMAVILLVAYLFYSRPMILSQLYPMITLDKCTEISGYYEVGAQAEPSEFYIEQNSGNFKQLCTLFFEQKYRRSLRDLFPRGTRIHRTEPNDFQWDVCFYFKDIEFPDGSVGTGAMLRFQNWYGELDVYFDGETYSCRTSEQEAWAKEVLEIIQ